MKKVITYGTYDMLHYGHIRLLERARALGDYLIVGVTSDSFDMTRGKINVKQPLCERMEAVKATGLADEVIVEEYEGQKIDDIRRYGVDIFTEGSDWTGKFDYLNEYCKVVYLERTQGVSSAELRAQERRLRIGLVGDSFSELEKFARESRYVNGVEIGAVYTKRPELFSEELKQRCAFADSYDSMLRDVDAVYLVTRPENHEVQIRSALEAGKHVLCESPIALSSGQAQTYFELAGKHDCVLMESLKTAYSLAFSRLQLLVKSGFIGEVVSVDATCTSLRSDTKIHGDDRGSLYAWGPFALLPVFSVLGTDYRSKLIQSRLGGDGRDIYTKVDFVFGRSVASAKVGIGVKSEGELIISGTKGYIFVPAPWWKTDYFEVRYENPQENKRYFYQLEGEGIRFMLVSFLRAVTKNKGNIYIPEKVTDAICDIMGDFNQRKDTVIL